MKLSTAHKIGRFFQYFVLILVGVIMPRQGCPSSVACGDSFPHRGSLFI